MTLLQASKLVNRGAVVKRKEMATQCIKWSNQIEKRQRHCLRQQVPYHPGSQIIAALFRTTLELPSLLAIAIQGGCCACENILCVSASVHVSVEGEKERVLAGLEGPSCCSHFGKQTGAEILIM